MGALLFAPVRLARPGSNLAEEQAESDDLGEVRSALKGALIQGAVLKAEAKQAPAEAEALPNAGAC